MERVRVWGLQLLTLTLLLLGVEAIVRLAWVDPLFVPAPSSVALAFGQISSETFPRLWDTFTKTAMGYLLSVILGVGFGLVVGSVRHLREVLNPYLVLIYGIPKILILPWVIVVFGFGVTPAVFYAFLQGFFPVAILVIGGVRDVDKQLIIVARSMGASPHQIYRKVILPAVLPSVLSGMKIAVVFCLLGVLIVEMFAGVRGMGFMMGSLANAFQAAKLFAVTILISAFSIGIVLGLEGLNNRLGRWRG